jgi:hypothetical protein
MAGLQKLLSIGEIEAGERSDVIYMPAVSIPVLPRHAGFELLFEVGHELGDRAAEVVDCGTDLLAVLESHAQTDAEILRHPKRRVAIHARLPRIVERLTVFRIVGKSLTSLGIYPISICFSSRSLLRYKPFPISFIPSLVSCPLARQIFRLGCATSLFFTEFLRICREARSLPSCYGVALFLAIPAVPFDLALTTLLNT